MKKVFTRNQVVITSLAVLIAIAGYVSYDKKNSNEEDLVVANTDVLISNQEVDETDGLGDTEWMELDEIENPGETILTNADVTVNDYAAGVKLNREQVRSKNKEILQKERRKAHNDVT